MLTTTTTTNKRETTKKKMPRRPHTSKPGHLDDHPLGKLSLYIETDLNNIYIKGADQALLAPIFRRKGYEWDKKHRRWNAGNFYEETLLEVHAFVDFYYGGNADDNAFLHRADDHCTDGKYIRTEGYTALNQHRPVITWSDPDEHSDRFGDLDKRHRRYKGADFCKCTKSSVCVACQLGCCGMVTSYKEGTAAEMNLHCVHHGIQQTGPEVAPAN